MIAAGIWRLSNCVLKLTLPRQAWLECSAGHVQVNMSHEFSELGLLERENASILNASLRPLADQIMPTFRAALQGAAMLRHSSRPHAAPLLRRLSGWQLLLLSQGAPASRDPDCCNHAAPLWLSWDAQDAATPQ